MKAKLIAILILTSLLLTGCGLLPDNEVLPDNDYPSLGGNNKPGGITPPGTDKPSGSGSDTPSGGDLGDDDTSFGESLGDLGAYDGFFEGDSLNFTVECLSGTKGAYKLDGSTLTFTAVSDKTAYSIKGEFKGNIVIDVGDEHKFELEMNGFSLVSDSANPIIIRSGDKITLKAKKDTENYIYDTRAAIDQTDESLYSGAIHSEVDLEISGKGSLKVISEKNNGIHSKDDLEVKNLTLTVAAVDNALKGNDSVSVTDATTTLIATAGDGIKTSASDISDKGNQRGIVTISGGTHEIYAACDGIDAAYDAVIEGDATILNIYTDKYSSYSEEVSAPQSDISYIRYSSNKYYYSVKYYNSDTDYIWVNAEYHSRVSGGRTSYYYYSYPKMPGYSKIKLFVYSSEANLGQESTYVYATDYLTPNTASDTIAISTGFNGKLSYSWTNYTTSIQGGGFPGGPGGGMGDGNKDKGDHSTKGIKAANEVLISGGTLSIKAYDDAIHANSDTALENGNAPLGNVTVSGGSVTVYSNDDGLHADGAMSISGGFVNVTNAYEGIEGNSVNISGGSISIYSKDDGINATATSGTAISISGGRIYIYCTGDGIDANTRTANLGIVFTGGETVVISNSGMNSSLDTENGYTYTAGSVIAIMPRGGMSNESTHASGFNSIGKSTQISLTGGAYLVATIKDTTATVKMPLSLSAFVVILGDSSASVTSSATSSAELDANGVSWS